MPSSRRPSAASRTFAARCSKPKRKGSARGDGRSLRVGRRSVRPWWRRGQGGGGGRNLLGRVMLARPDSRKRELGTAAMHLLQGAGFACFPAPPPTWLHLAEAFWKKRGSIRRWSLMTGSKSKSEVMANDEGGGYAICRVGIGRGRRIRRQPGCRRSGPREEEMVQITSTGTIWTVPEMSAMRAPACQLCAQRK